MKNRFLVIRFGDNDFGKSLKVLGRYMLKEVGKEVLEKMYTDQHQFKKILTVMFRSNLALYQHNFDMFCDYSSNKKLLSAMEAYMTLDYYAIHNVEFVETIEDEGADMATLVIDFKKEKVFMV